MTLMMSTSMLPNATAKSPMRVILIIFLMVIILRINEENDEEVELGEEVVRVKGVRIPAQDEINHIQQVVCIDDDNIPAPESVSTEATSLNIFDDVFSD